MVKSKIRVCGAHQQLWGGLMVSRYIVPFLILILLGGCARTTATTLDMVIEVSDSSQYEDGLVLFEGDWDELVGMDYGLTTKGCRIFFAQDEVVCLQTLQTWRRLDYDDKVSFFYVHASVFNRGLWNYRREQEHLDILKKKGEMTEAELQEELHSIISPQLALKCVASKRVHEDFCLLLYEPFASPTETKEASLRWLREDYKHITAEAH